MLIDLEAAPDDLLLEAEVCIVGAGAAGVALARDLMKVVWPLGELHAKKGEKGECYAELRTELGDEGVRNSNAGLALQMQQTPFIQEFAGDGSPGFILMLPGLQVLNTHLASLAATLLEVEP